MEKPHPLAKFFKTRKLTDAYAGIIDSAESGRIRIKESMSTFARLIKDPEVRGAIERAHERGIEIQAILYQEPERAYFCYKSLEIPIPGPLYSIGNKFYKFVNRHRERKTK